MDYNERVHFNQSSWRHIRPACDRPWTAQPRRDHGSAERSPSHRNDLRSNSSARLHRLACALGDLQRRDENLEAGSSTGRSSYAAERKSTVVLLNYSSTDPEP